MFLCIFGLLLLSSGHRGASQISRVEIRHEKSTAVENRPLVTGGPTEARQGDDWSQKAAETVRQQIELQLGTRYSSYRVLEYATQVVSGINWYFKIAGDGSIILLVNAFQPFGSNDLQLRSVRTTTDISSPLIDRQSGMSSRLTEPDAELLGRRYVMPVKGRIQSVSITL